MKVHRFIQIGRRGNQEDALHIGRNAFVVCDGMGGHAKGELASGFVASQVAAGMGAELSKQHLEQQFDSIQRQLNERYGFEPETVGMGTTFCGVFFSETEAYLAYAGDSRIYWFKPTERKIWHTWDHSLVGELVRQGDISREQGRSHPMSSRISRAFIANSENRTVSPDIYRADNIAQGDLFLLCSDGVTEAWTDEQLVRLMLEDTLSSQDKLAAVQRKCAEDAKDNNTAILLEVEAKDVRSNGTNEEIVWLRDSDFGSDHSVSVGRGSDRPERKEPKAFDLQLVFYVLAVLLVAITIVILVI